MFCLLAKLQFLLQKMYCLDKKKKGKIQFEAELKRSKQACTAGGEVAAVNLRVVTHTQTLSV